MARRAIPQPTFGTLPTIDGFDVILNDSGRAVSHRSTRRSANGVCYVLNRAVRAGDNDALVRVLGAGGRR